MRAGPTDALPVMVFLQRPSLWLALLAWKEIARAGRVALFPAWDVVEGTAAGPRVRRVTGWIRFVNPRATVEEVAQEILVPCWHQNNLESDAHMDEFFQVVKASASFRLMCRLLGTERLDRYYKSRLLPWLVAETLFYRVARVLAGESRLVLLPASADPFGLHRYFFPREEFSRVVPWTVRWGLRGAHWIRRLANTLVGGNLAKLVLFVLHPLLAALVQVRRSSPPVDADVIMPLTSGFREERWTGEAGHDDGFLLGGDLTPARIAYYWSDWKFSPVERARQTEWMQARGVRFFDPDRLPVAPRVLRELGAFCVRLWSRAFSPSLLAEDPRIATSSAALACHFLTAWRFARAVNFKVSVEWQDYSPVHVVRTLVANRLGRLTLGMHHGIVAPPLAMPVIRYTDIDRLCVWGQAFADMHGDHWKHMRLVPVGAYRADFVLQAGEGSRSSELRERYASLYGGGRPLILVLFSTLNWFVVRSRVEEWLEGLRLLAVLPGEFRVVCRFRTRELKEEWLRCGLREIAAADFRIVVDTEQFTTYEWMALSDMVIAATHSTGLIEAAVAGKACAAFDQMMAAETVIGKYDSSMVLKTRHDLVRAVRAIQAGQWSMKGAEAFAKDFSYYADGRSIDRLREAILKAVRDVEGGLVPDRTDGVLPDLVSAPNG